MQILTFIVSVVGVVALYITQKKIILEEVPEFVGG